jgi:hypothetical protein
MKYSGLFHLGVHKVTTQEAGVARGDHVEVTIEIDDEPLPTDAVPHDLKNALASEPNAAASWDRLAPAVGRGYVKNVVEAKKDETRARRIIKIVETLRAGVPPRRTWKPSGR